LTFLRNDLDDFGSQFKGKMGRASAVATWDVRRHSILFGGDYTNSTIDTGSHRVPPPPGQPPGNPVLLAQDKTREIAGLTLQDQFEIYRKLTVIAGARYDSYSDFQSRVTPRAAVIYRASD